MKSVFVALFLMLGLFSSLPASAYNGQVLQGAQLQGRQYWFDTPEDEARLFKDLKKTLVVNPRPMMCNSQRKVIGPRVQECHQCGWWDPKYNTITGLGPVTCR